jgi:hypothetical protein
MAGEKDKAVVETQEMLLLFFLLLLLLLLQLILVNGCGLFLAVFVIASHPDPDPGASRPTADRLTVIFSFSPSKS